MIFNMTGGGSGSGATLVVSCPANVTVTVSKDDKSYTKNSGNLGSATFKGVATGEWTVTIEGNEQTATKNITITADYAITMAFFAAYINITYPANSNCVVQTSGGTTVASDSNATSSAKTWTATVNATGTYTVTATATDGSGKSKSQSVSITADGQSESVTLTYNILYQAGDTDTGFLSVGWPFTNGAWEGKPKIAYNTTAAVFTAPDGEGSTSGVVYFPDKIDLTPYTTLTADATLAGSINNDTRPEGLYIWSKIKSGYYQDNSVASALFGGTGKKILTIDVSKLSGEYYIGFGLRRELTPVETITLRKVELE